jgi:hypothetical protein
MNDRVVDMRLIQKYNNSNMNEVFITNYRMMYYIFFFLITFLL